MNDSNTIDLWRLEQSFYVLEERRFMQRLLFSGIRPSVLLLHRQRVLDRIANRRRLRIEDCNSDDDSVPPLVHPYEDSESDNDSLPPLEGDDSLPQVD